MPIANSTAVDVEAVRHRGTKNPLVGYVTDANPDPQLSIKIPYWRYTKSDNPKLLAIKVPAPRHWQLPANSAHSAQWRLQGKDAKIQRSLRLTKAACWADISELVEAFGSQAQPKWHRPFLAKNGSNPFTVKQYPRKRLSQVQNGTNCTYYKEARVDGQTIGYVMPSSCDYGILHNPNDFVAVLGYKSKAAMWYHTDTQCKSCDSPRHLTLGEGLANGIVSTGARTLGPIAFLMRGFGSDFPGTDLPHGVEWWPGVSNVLEPTSQGLVHSFKDAWENDRVRPLLEMLARIDGNIPCYAIRVGDVCDPSGALDGEALAVGATLAAGFLAHLKNTTIGLANDSTPRYTQHPLDTPHTWGGYHVDDWISAALHYFVFVQRREIGNPGIFAIKASKEPAENTKFVCVFDHVLDPPDITDAIVGVAAGTPATSRKGDLDYLKTMLRSARAVKGGMRKSPMTHKEFIMRSCAKPDIFSPIDRKVQLVEAANSRYKPADWVLPKVDVDCLDMLTTKRLMGANFKQPQEHHPFDGVDELPTPRTHPFSDTSMTDAHLLVEGLLLTKRMVGDFSMDDFDVMVIDNDMVEPDKFDLAVLAKKYHWAVNLALAGSLTGKLLLPHQIIGQFNCATLHLSALTVNSDALICHRLEISGLKGWINGSDVGIGKTFTTLLCVEMAYFEALKALSVSPDGDHNFTPTLLVVPSQLMVQTHREAIENFTGLDIRLFHGSVGDLGLSDTTRAMTDKDLDMACRQWRKNRRNPEQVKTVILTTLETLSRQLLSQSTIRIPRSETSAWMHDACGLPKNVVVNVWERMGRDSFGDTTDADHDPVIDEILSARRVGNFQESYYYGSFRSRFPR